MKFLAILLLLCAIYPAHAGSLAVSATRDLVFTGTLTNNSAASNLYLNDIAASFDGAENLALNANTFFENVPGILLPNESYTESELFRLGLSAGTAAGDSAGTIVLRGGSDIIANDDLGTIACRILQPAFDPASVSGLATAIFVYAQGQSADGSLGLVPDLLAVSFIPDLSDPGKIYLVEASTDLVNWSAANVEEIAVSNPNPPALRSFRYNGPVNPGRGVFLRLRVEQNKATRR